MRRLVFSLCLMVGVGVFMGSGGLVWAGPPDIHIDLSFDKSRYEYGEPVGMEVVVRNDSVGDILISNGFTSKTYYWEMRVIDPARRLLLPTRDELHDEFPDAPPLAFILYEGRAIRVASCEVMPFGWWKSSRAEDLRVHYPLELPGNYSAQVQLSAMVFKGEAGDPCDVNDYEWLGVLKSQTKYFYIQGATEGVRVIPSQWSLLWREEGSNAPDVQVQVWPEDGREVGDYDLQSIRLNNVVVRRVETLSPMIKAFFDPREAIGSLREVEVGQWYTVTISGRFKTGERFVREQQVRIVR